MLPQGIRIAELSWRGISNTSRSERRSYAPSLATSPITGILRRSAPNLTTSSVSRSTLTRRLLTVVTNPSKASQWPLLVIFGGSLVAAIVAEPYLRHLQDQSTAQSPLSLSSPQQVDSVHCAPPRTLLSSEMPTPPGHLGNLTPEQEQKLRDFWVLLLKIFDVRDPNTASGASGPSEIIQSGSENGNQPPSPKPTGTTTEPSKKTNSKKLQSIFSSSSSKKTNTANDTPSTPSAAFNSSATDGDKYGQTKDFQQTLGEMSPEQLRTTFWSMVKADHPDALLLRFLRARKWDAQRALVMLISTMRWRCKEMHVDDDVVRTGEGGALANSRRTDDQDSGAKKEGEDFLAQMRKGKSFLHGLDKEGRPLCFVRVRLHKQGEQSERSMERYTVHVIETARLVLRPPVETATILFDMTSFAISNMDYAPVKFMIKVFEANYPESLGAVLVHKAPWVFQSIWSIIKGWLDPVVAAKVHFTKTVEDLERFIPKSHIVKELGGEEDWEYRYLEPAEGENAAMEDTQTRQKLEEERNGIITDFTKTTFDWLAIAAKTPAPEEEEKGKNKDTSAPPTTLEERSNIAKRLNDNYWCLDPYVRARSLYDRQGMIGPTGRIEFYPPPPDQQQGSKTANGTAALANGPNLDKQPTSKAARAEDADHVD